MKRVDIPVQAFGQGVGFGQAEDLFGHPEKGADKGGRNPFGQARPSHRAGREDVEGAEGDRKEIGGPEDPGYCLVQEGVGHVP